MWSPDGHAHRTGGRKGGRNGGRNGHGRRLGRALAVLALAGLAGLAGCGFRPLYGDLAGSGGESDGGGGGTAADALARVDVAVIAEREGQQLRAFLLERLNPGGRPADPAWRLEVELSESERTLATAPDDTVTRASLSLLADFVLTDAQTGALLLERRYQSIGSFNIQDDVFANRISRDDVRTRALRDIAERIRRELALFAQRTGGAGAG